MSDYTWLDPTKEALRELSNADYAEVERLCMTIDADVESWFRLSVACCDACIDEYIAAWPNAYRHDEAFQQNRMGFSDFYNSSRRVKDAFSEDEFNRLLEYVACPRCLHSIGPNLYPYELPFSVPEDWEIKQKTLAERASKTPFLLLRETFAQQIYDNLKNVCSNIEPADLMVDLFRGRTSPETLSESAFLAPPPKATPEGRYNHAGIPVLYLSTKKITCWKECEQPSANFYICRISLTKPIKILNLAESEELEESLRALIFSSLMSAPASKESGWHKPEYALTRFVADCVKDNGIQAIVYPSVRYGEGNNIAILDLDDCDEWLRVSEIEEYRHRVTVSKRKWWQAIKKWWS